MNAIIFVAALSEYDQVLFEDEVTNRMVEALNLFESIANHPSFSSTSIILFLNKRDLFADKIGHVPISSVEPFAEFQGGTDYELGCEYFCDKFLEKCNNPSKKVYSHVTCATDTSNIDFVFKSCTQIVLDANIEDNFLS